MSDSVFYKTYSQFKQYETPQIGKSTIRGLDKIFWHPLECSVDSRVLEIGCGLGHFLLYLKAKGVREFTGLDSDANIARHLPPAIAEHFRVLDIRKFIKTNRLKYDRVVMFDVLEHFDIDDALALLIQLKKLLSPNGQILIRVPNAASPWGLQNQFGDLTHRIAFTPDSLRQLIITAGFQQRLLFSHEEGTGFQKFMDRMTHKVLKFFIKRVPPIWTANFCMVIVAR